MALDRLRFHNILVQEMGAPSEAAADLAAAIDDGFSDVATKQDVLVLRLELQNAFKDEMNRLLRWLIAGGFTIGGVIIALLIALIVRGG